VVVLFSFFSFKMENGVWRLFLCLTQQRARGVRSPKTPKKGVLQKIHVKNVLQKKLRGGGGLLPVIFFPSVFVFALSGRFSA
jgi:hypothetical protein